MTNGDVVKVRSAALGLWSRRDFALYWTGQSVSKIGSRVGGVVVPTLAILVLHGGPIEVAALAALPWAPYVVLGPLAGVWCDRWRRRRTMVVADVVRAVALGSIPLAHVAGVLTIWQLLAVSLLVGLANVFFDVAEHAYRPSLLERAEYVEGNAKLQLSESVATVLGPVLAGVLITAVGAATAVTVDAVSFLVSAASLLLLRHVEAPRVAADAARRLGQELREGIRTVRRSRYLVFLAGSATTGNFALSMTTAIVFLYLYRELGLTPGDVGLLLGLGGGAFVLGAALSRAVISVVGIGRVLVLSPLLLAGGILLLPAAKLVAIPLVLVGLSQVLTLLQTGPANVAILTVLQASVPNELLGRVNGVTLPFVLGFGAIGATLGGVVASLVGYEWTLVVAAAVAAAGVLWVVCGPLASIEGSGADIEPAAEAA
jgi:predicted MFS family arabinose efflux permease